MAASKLKYIIFRHSPSNDHSDIEDVLVYSNMSSKCGPSECVAITGSSGITSERIIVDHDNSVMLASKEVTPASEWNNFRYSLTLYTNSAVGSAIGYTCRRSTNFVRSFIKYSRRHGKRQKNQSTKADQSSKTVIIIYMHNPEQYWLDFLWNCMVHTLVYKHIAFEDGMAWLNTLGGGYSALGDYFTHHAKSAAKVSLQQLKIAMEIGDPGVIIRCTLYYAQSLMQRGHLRQAKHAIRHLYHEGLMKCPHDRRLHAMCHGLWNRLKYCYTLRSKGKPKQMISNGLHYTNGVTYS